MTIAKLSTDCLNAIRVQNMSFYLMNLKLANTFLKKESSMSYQYIKKKEIHALKKMIDL